MAAMEPEALSLMMGEPEGNVNTLRQVTGRKKRAKSITAQDYLNAMRSQSRKQMTHNEFKGSGMHPMDTLALSTMAIPGFGDVAGLAADARGYMSGDLKPTKLNMGMTAMGALPFVPGAMGGMVKAFHGTPHKVDKFKMDKIGTGEGAQSYGYGLYFAENPKVAGQYQYDLSRNVGNINATPSAHKYAADDFFKNDYSLEDAREGMKAAYPDITDMELETALNESYRTQGNLYNVNLDVNPEDLLDWDAPLSEQPQKVRDALLSLDDPLINNAINSQPISKDGGDYWEYLGNTYATKSEALDDASGFEIVMGRTGIGKTPEEVSKALKQAGIPGIQYYDGMSRNAGEGTRNYVMFDEDLIEINNPSSLNDLVKPQGKQSLGDLAGVDDYKGMHTAPRFEEGYKNSLDNLSDIYPDDLYSNQGYRYYGHGGDAVGMDKETINIVKQFKGNADKKVKIFRAVPKGVKSINKGDWVTVNKNYAKEHGYRHVGDDYKIVELEVSAKDVFNQGDSIHEFGYDPQP